MGIIDGTFEKSLEEDEEHKLDFMRWRRLNAAALHAIQISCAPESFYYIMQYSEAKVAWNALNYNYSYNPPTKPESSPQVMAEEVDYDVEDLYKAICENNWSNAKAFIDQHYPSALKAGLTISYDTALHVAAWHGHVSMVEELVALVPPQFLEIVNTHGATPLVIAAAVGDTRIVECMVNKNNNTLSIPTHYLRLPVEVAIRNVHKELGRYLYSHTPLDCLKPGKGIQGPLLLFQCFIAGDIGMKEIYEAKWLHTQASHVLRLICSNATAIVRNDIFAEALFHAAKEGNVEFVAEVTKANPSTILFSHITIGPNMFFHVVKYRQAEIFNLIHEIRFKTTLASMIDPQTRDTMLQMAGKLAPSSELNCTSGTAMQMQSEIQWFKEVENLVPPGFKVLQNKDGMKAEDIFKESHKELRKEGEKWMKETASSCSVVGALIVTIMFTAAFTIPGGNNQNSGYPIFFERQVVYAFHNIRCVVIIFFNNFCAHVSWNPYLTLCRRRFP